MRRNIDEAKAALALRLEEYNVKRRAKRKMCACAAAVVLTAAVTVGAVPAIVANSRGWKNAEATLAEHGDSFAEPEANESFSIFEEGSNGTPNGAEESQGNISNEGSTDGEKAVGSEITEAFGELALSVIWDGTETVLAEKDCSAVIETLKRAVLTDGAPERGDVICWLSVKSGEKNYLIGVTGDGYVTYEGENYSVEDAETLIGILNNLLTADQAREKLPK